MKKYQYAFDGRENDKQNLLSTNRDNLSNDLHVKSTTSTNQQTHNKTSTDNLYIHKLQSLILDLQRQADQQQFQMHTLSQQSSIFMRMCQQQKQVIDNMNIQALKNEYGEQIKQMEIQRQKIQQIINQLRIDYDEAFKAQQIQLTALKITNQEICTQINTQLENKKNLLSDISSKNKTIQTLQQQIQNSEQKMDELRNIQRKFNIAMKQIETMKSKEK